MTYASVSDVEVDFGEIPADQHPKVTALLERAEAQLLRAFPDLDTRLADGRTDEVLVVQVESEMVAAVLRNPQAAQSTTKSETTGPFTQSQTVNVNLAAASGLLRLSAEHRALLGEVPMPGPFTVPLGGGCA